MTGPGRDIRVPPSTVFIVSAIVYFAFVLPTVSREIGWTDSGELLAVGYTLGIAHPTGYPLLTLLTRVILSLTQEISGAFVVNLFSAACMSVSAGLVALIIVETLRRQRKKWKGSGVPIDAASASFGGAWAFGSIGTVWDQSVFFEVYALQSVLFTGAIYSLLLAGREESEDSASVSRYWAIAGLLVGFGFANHMSTLYLVPGIILLSVAGRTWDSIRMRWSVMGLATLLGCTLYLYLFVRAGSDPPLNWGDPDTASSLLAHLSGKQYSIWMFTDMKAFMTQAGKFARQLPSDVGWVVCVSSVIGGAALSRKDVRLLFFLLLLGGMSTLYSFTYDILDLESYFLLFFVVLGILTGLAFFEVIQKSSSRLSTTALAGMIIAVGCALLVFRLADKWNAARATPEPFARTVLHGVEDGSTIFTSKWDFLYSPSLALQTVERYRPDILLIDVHLLRDRSWYVRQTWSKIAVLIPEARSSFDQFLVELEKFERGETVIYDVIRARWTRLLSDLLRGARARGPVYVDHLTVQEFSADIVPIPSGFLLRDVASDSVRSVGPLPALPLIEPKNDEFGADYTRFVSVAYLNHAIHARTLGMRERADSAFSMATRVDPSNPALASFPTLPTQ